MKKQIRRLGQTKNLLLAGSMATQSTRLMGNTGNIHALTGDIGGFVGIGVAGAASDLPLKMMHYHHKKQFRRR